MAAGTSKISKAIYLSLAEVLKCQEDGSAVEQSPRGWASLVPNLLADKRPRAPSMLRHSHGTIQGPLEPAGHAGVGVSGTLGPTNQAWDFWPQVDRTEIGFPRKACSSEKL